MKNALYLSLLVLLFASCNLNQKQEDTGKGQIDKICDSVMSAIAKSQFPQAFDILKQNTVMSASAIDTLKATTIDYSKNVFPTYGEIRSYEFVTERKVKDVVAKRFYILKFDKYYLKVDFTLYNNGDKWTIASFSYSEELVELLY